LSLGPAFIGLLVALPALTAMTAWPALEKLSPGRRLPAAVLVAMTYLMASYLALGRRLLTGQGAGHQFADRDGGRPGRPVTGYLRESKLGRIAATRTGARERTEMSEICDRWVDFFRRNKPEAATGSG